MSSKGTPAVLATGPRGAIPSYSFPENAAMALGAAARYGAWRAQPKGAQLALPPDREQAIRAWVRAWHVTHPDGGWLALDEIAALLALAGVVLAEHRTTAPTAAAAAAAAVELSGPVVLQAIAPGLIHKSDVGGVAVDLADASAVTAAAERMRAQFAERDMPLDGFRGAPPADRAALTDVLVRISALVELVPELRELDLNPVIVHAHGAMAVDARMRLRGNER
jgi:acyl-CoA synthetase (NDP forming)